MDIDNILNAYGLRKTRARIAILEVLLEQHKPLTAQTLLQLVQERYGDEDLWLSTVYRNLEQFMEKRMVQSISQPDADTQLYRLSLGKHNHYAICEACHREIPLDICPLDTIDQDLKRQGFTPTGHVLEIFGICKACRLQANR